MTALVLVIDDGAARWSDPPDTVLLCEECALARAGAGVMRRVDVGVLAGICHDCGAGRCDGACEGLAACPAKNGRGMQAEKLGVFRLGG